MNDIPKLDLKDYEILRELDLNFRESFSRIGKNVKLSKNSVSLRFDKLKKYMLHNTVGINNKILGFTEVRVYYSFDFYNEDIERVVVNELKKYKNILWVAHYYGPYDLILCFLVSNFDDLIKEINKFNHRFASKINNKEVHIGSNQSYFRYNFIHKNPINKVYKIESNGEVIILTETEKKILRTIRHNPRMSLVDISKETGLSLKTISDKLKSLEKRGIIMGYFMTLDPVKFKHNTFKLLIQMNNLKNEKEIEEYLSNLKNIKYIFKMSGLWDYEIDFIYPSVRELQNQIEDLKEKFPNTLKKISILSFRKRILTKENFPI